MLILSVLAVAAGVVTGMDAVAALCQDTGGSGRNFFMSTGGELAILAWLLYPARFPRDETLPSAKMVFAVFCIVFYLLLPKLILFITTGWGSWNSREVILAGISLIVWFCDEPALPRTPPVIRSPQRVLRRGLCLLALAASAWCIVSGILFHRAHGRGSDPGDILLGSLFLFWSAAFCFDLWCRGGSMRPSHARNSRKPRLLPD
jgi:hypothetical protein